MHRWEINMIFNNWVIINYATKNSYWDDFFKTYNFNKLICDIIYSKNLRELDNFLTLQLNMVESPFLLKDMLKSIDRINKAIALKEKIVVYGDYDCDGIVSASMLYLFLKSKCANVSCYIPSRLDEGYGLNIQAISKLKSKNVDLIITVDNGISAIKEADFAKENGIDLIITDHHQVSEQIPNAYSVVNPHRRDCESDFKKICGAGVALKLITAIEGGDYTKTLDEYADLLAIATIGDVVPLIDENRIFVKYGLERLKFTRNIGLKSLIKTCNLNEYQEIESDDVAFKLVPKINSAGRIGDPRIAFKLLTCQDQLQADTYANYLTELNIKRKQLENEILLDIEKIILSDPKMIYSKILVFFSENWNQGIIGIVCSRLIEKYGKPVVILSVTGNTATGSCRSLGSFNIYNALSYCSEILIKYGGHKLAAGLTLHKNNINAFILKINKYANSTGQEIEGYTYYIETEITLKEITFNSVKELDLLKPYGSQNEKPMFIIKNLIIKKLDLMGAQKNHVKILLEDKSKDQASGIKFNFEKNNTVYKLGNCVDIVCHLEINNYKGICKTSVIIVDIRKAGFNQEKYFKHKKIYEKFISQGKLDKSLLQTDCIPNRDEIALVYTYLKKCQILDINYDYFYAIFDNKLNYFKFKIIFSILIEVGLIKLNFETMVIQTPKSKVDLLSSNTYALVKNSYNINLK